MNSPVGELMLISSNKGLSAILWEADCLDKVQVRPKVKDCNHKILKQAKAEITQYFAGSRKHFSVPLDPMGTDFQLKVWNELKNISYGETISYKELATQIKT